MSNPEGAERGRGASARGFRYVGSRFEAENASLLAEAQSLANDAVLSELLPAHPQLLNPYVLKNSLDRLRPEDRHSGNRAHDVIAIFDFMRFALEDHPELYEFGKGPIEPIWTAVTRRHLSQQYAAEKVAEPDVTWRLSGAYLRALSMHANAITLERGRWRDGWALQELLLAAVMALPAVADVGELRPEIEADFAFMYEETAGDWLATALTLLCQVPDGRVYRRAQAIGDDLLSRFRRKDETERVGRVLFRLGGLSLDPYLGMPLRDADTRQALRHRLLGALDSAEAEAIDWAEADMPPVSQALELAEAQFREAAELRTGVERGIALKAHFQALRSLMLLGRNVSDGELRAVARSALSLLDPDQDQQHINYIHAEMRQAGLDVSDHAEPEPGPGRFNPLAPATLDREFEAEFMRAELLAADDPVHAVEVMLALHDRAEELGTEYRKRLWRAERRQLADAVRRGYRWPGSFRRGGRPRGLADIARRVERAMRLQSSDREEEAIRVLLPVLTKFPPDTAAVWLWDPLWYFAMDLEVGAAVNNVERAPAVSVDWYALALQAALSLRLEGGVSDMVRRLGWLARDNPTYEVGAAVCAGLMPVSLEIMSFGPNARYELYRTGQYAFAAAAQKTAGTLGRSGLVTSDQLRQMIKGLSFAAALQQDATYSVAKDATGQRDLRLIAGLTGDQPLAEDDAATLFDEKVLLTRYVSDREVRSGRSPSERLANAQRAFDQHVFDHLTDPRVVAYHATSPDEIKSLLDQRTILADMLLVAGEDERLITYTAVYTSDQVKMIACTSADLPGQAHWAGPEGELLFHPTAPFVSFLREKIQEYPGLGRDATPEALEGLQEAADLLFGGAEGIGVFEDLRATGRDRLVVVPHGPLHFLPFHLLPFEDRVLADRFTVTVLPNRELLRPRAGQPGPARQMQAFGLTFTDGEPFGLPPIAASSQEAREVAQCFDIEPTLDAHATETAFRSALRDARYVHLSTHGRNNTAGAVFQSLYLWPDESSDGRLHAYELLDLDLHNVDLLTLSACETGLGRFDLLDNLRGLPAAFLLRGVRTLIGTLWDTEVTTASFFFRTLYSHLRAAPCDKGGAFRAAQEETRSRFPQYRDWGAFYLMGAS